MIFYFPAVKYWDLLHYFSNISRSFQDKRTYLYTRRIDWCLLEVVLRHEAPSTIANTKKKFNFVEMNGRQNIGAIFEFYCLKVEALSYPLS